MNQSLTFEEITKIYSDEDKARETLETLRWPNGAVCPHCESYNVYKLTPKQGSSTRKGLWKCGSCRKQFTVTVGTIFHGSRIPLGKWLMAIHLICASKKGISTLQLMRQLWPDDGFVRADGSYKKDHYKTAFFMAHRIRYAMAQEPLRSKLLSGVVEADETYVGGKAKNMHAHKKAEALQGRKGGTSHMAPVVTLVERGGNVKTHHMEHVTSGNIKKMLKDWVRPKVTTLMTDESRLYENLGPRNWPDRQSVNHSNDEWVRGVVHIATAESVHALLKRGVMGTYHHWSKKHLHRYLAEFDFRWNYRKVSDGERTAEAIAIVGGKRLRYKDPIKKH